MITIPEGVKTVASCVFSKVFSSCKNLKKVIIPAFVSKIYSDAFKGCKSLTDIIVDDNNINYTSFDGVLYSKDMTEFVSYPWGKSGNSYVVPDGVTVVHSDALRGSKIRKITLPASINKLEYGSLYRIWDINYKGTKG